MMMPLMVSLSWLSQQAEAGLNLTDILNNPLVDKTFAVVIVFVLLRFLREDMARLTEAINAMTVELRATTTEIRNLQAHNTTRMEEIRTALREMIQLWSKRDNN